MPVSEMLKCHVRWMIRADMPDVCAIDLKHGLGWTNEDFLVNLRQRNCIGMVVEQGDQIVGFMIYTLHKSKLEILNLASANRNDGSGTAMIDKLKNKLCSHKRTRIAITLDERNLNGLRFLKNRGFVATRLFRGEFDQYDGIRMVYHHTGE